MKAQSQQILTTNDGTFRGYNNENENIVIYDSETLEPIDSLHITEELRQIQQIVDQESRNKEIEDVYKIVKNSKTHPE